MSRENFRYCSDFPDRLNHNDEPGVPQMSPGNPRYREQWMASPAWLKAGDSQSRRSTYAQIQADLRIHDDENRSRYFLRTALDRYGNHACQSGRHRFVQTVLEHDEQITFVTMSVAVEMAFALGERAFQWTVVFAHSEPPQSIGAYVRNGETPDLDSSCLRIE